MRKKVTGIIMILSMVMVTAMIPLSDISYGASEDVIKWTEGITGGAIYFDKETGTITDCDESVSEVVIPEEIGNVKVAQIKYLAFDDCTLLTSITLPRSIEDIGSDAFKGCFALSDITIDDNNNSYSSENGILFNKDKTVLYKYPSGKTEDAYIIPETVKIIWSKAFEGCEYIKKITIPSNVTDILEGAFESSNSLTVYGTKNSYAEYYANQNNIPFVDIDISVVATIGDVKYESLSEAFQNASGKKIELLQDVELTEPINVSADEDDITINLNGNTISAVGDNRRVFNLTSNEKAAGKFYILANNNSASKINGEIYLETNTVSAIDSDIFNWDNIKYNNEEYTPCVDIVSPTLEGETTAEYIMINMKDEDGHLFFHHIYKSGDIYFMHAEIPENLKKALNLEDIEIDKWANYASFNDISPDGEENFYGSSLLAVKNEETIEQAIKRNMEYAKANNTGNIEPGMTFTEPSYDGYDFLGWYTADVDRDENYKIIRVEYKEVVKPDSNITSDVQLYSKWEEQTEPAIIDISEKDAELSYASIPYNGRAHKPVAGIEGLAEGTDFTVEYFDNIYVGTATVTIKGIGNYTGTITKTFEIAKPNSVEVIFGNSSAKRFYGDTRYETAIQAARAVKVAQGVDKFNTIIVAYGDDYADALAGSYLAKVKNAPIILVNRGTEAITKQYIDDNLKSDGTVYILGGEGVISEDFERSLGQYTVKRLGGKDRFETNLLILREAGTGNEDILICSGFGFADSLSASAVGKPILLVGDKLTENQKSYLSELSGERKYYIIGGTGAVNTVVEDEVSCYRIPKRVAGANRYATSEEVAREFFGNDVDVIVVAYGLNFPDGLCGGPMAMELGCPLLLATDGNLDNAKAYAGDALIRKLAVLGGSALISNRSAIAILG